MIAAYLISVLLLVLTLLFFVHRKWENSSYVKTIDLIPGPSKQFFVGNALALPKETNGMKLSLSLVV
jgi:cytochrome P450 family 4